MGETVIYAPDIDNIIEFLKRGNNLVSSGNYMKLVEIYDTFSIIKPGPEDKIRQTWIEAERGPIEAFGEYREYLENGEVQSLPEFEQLWKSYYPEPTKWYNFQTTEYKNCKYFYLDDKLFATIYEDYSREENQSFLKETFEDFINWLLERIHSDIKRLRDDPSAYNLNISQNLPFTKRYGKIKRTILWDILDENAVRFDKNLGAEIILKLKQFVDEDNCSKAPLLNEMTANTFFGICEICYNANNYFTNRRNTLTPREKYKSLADGRDADLSNIDGNSAKDFYDWYHSGKTLGAHPWEICRGGNSTHISLYVIESNDGWFFSLAGSSTVRVEETVRMTVALYENKIHFELRDKEEIMRMVTGNDFIGIVPNHIYPVYCHGLFPKEDEITDFMNLGFDPELMDAIINKAVWYPLPAINVLE